ncbi:MAG: UDP-3-O-(3-hydroxymyristoyl)glucosamine N-acyltransferase [Bacteroidetes bacterium]|nr:UDP-3-O-(3-hydroxymyristoyl)glucosamine N-acyltransferase [Bacteroidota bacterium]MBL7103619.1 UDP-3-O-(3-hydroxymyristoyl)glucosamine N-acyltransferase [Bacteroidales bacterium]
MKFEKPQKLKNIALIINAEFDGDPDFIVSGINEIHMVESGDLTFVDHPKYYEKALSSKATTILINKKTERPEGKALLFSKDPFSDYMKLVKKFKPFVQANSMISETADIGEGTIIQPGVFTGNNVKIGKNCIIHANVSIYDHTIIGDNVIIHSGTVLGADAFYFQKRENKTLKFESCGRVVIKDNVEIGACCTIDKGVSGDTIIDEYTKFDNHIQIGHDTYVGKRCLFASAVIIGGVSRIEDDVILWGQVAIDKDLTIGKGAVILGTSAVGKSLEGNKVYFGAPAIEARKKWKELVMIRKLPEIYEKLNNITTGA